MGFKLPFKSKDQEDSLAGETDIAVLDEPQPASEPAAAPVNDMPPQAAQEEAAPDFKPAKIKRAKEKEHNPNATLIGDVLQRSGDIKLPLIGKLPLQEQVRILLIALGSVLALGGLFVWINSSHSTLTATQTQIAGELLMHSQRIGKAAPNAIQGNVEAFGQLDDSRKEFNKNLNILVKGGEFQGRSIAEPNAKMKVMLGAVEKTWNETDKSAAIILKRKEELSGFGATLQRMNTLSPVLLELTEQVSTMKLQGGATAREISASGQLVMLTQRLGRSANLFLTAEGVNPETAFLLGKDTNTFRDITEGFLNGSDVLKLSATKEPQIREKLIELQNVFGEYQKLVATILGSLQNFIDAKQSEQLIFKDNEGLKKRLGDLQSTYRALQDSRHWTFWTLMACVALALVAAFSLVLVLLQDGRNRTKEAEERQHEAEDQRLQAMRQEEEAKRMNEQNQAAILRLMNELQEVADGDLTVQATVSEDITGAIADSVNYTVEELRGLVGRVTLTAEKVTSASNQAQNISDELLAASHKQSREIQETGQAVLEMAAQITDVSRS
ncbi:MAG: methyl-accepting chemotaxis protein, partial [Paucimonas sp.]|nr:methyl-accepting chemotaxis protein [Paucimonas sp.]